MSYSYWGAPKPPETTEQHVDSFKSKKTLGKKRRKPDRPFILEKLSNTFWDETPRWWVRGRYETAEQAEAALQAHMKKNQAWPHQLPILRIVSPGSGKG